MVKRPQQQRHHGGGGCGIWTDKARRGVLAVLASNASPSVLWFSHECPSTKCHPGSFTRFRITILGTIT
jgi:hypothetical protein